MTTSFTRRIASPPDSCFHDYYLRRCNIRSAVQCFVSSTSTKQLESLSSPAWSASRLSSVRPVLHSLRDRDRNRLGYPSAPVLGINRKFLLLIPIFTSVNPCAASDVRPSNQSSVIWSQHLRTHYLAHPWFGVPSSQPWFIHFSPSIIQRRLLASFSKPLFYTTRCVLTGNQTVSQSPWDSGEFNPLLKVSCLEVSSSVCRSYKWKNVSPWSFGSALFYTIITI